YLLRAHTVSYVPSASVLEELATPRPGSAAPAVPPLRFLAFADPASGTGDLPQSRQEGSEIARLFPPSAVRVFVGQEANKRNVRDWAARGERIQFATHGKFDEEHPERSGLLLAPEGGEDGRLRISDVFALKLNADLVVLSGCKTGLGKQVTGEGLVGLSRAFFYAGAPSLVVSLWQVAEESTPRLMLDFYRQLERKVDKGEALQIAKLDMLNDGQHAHPYYWAPFVLVGDPKPKK